jgi:type IV pilus assembly protein PilY1
MKTNNPSLWLALFLACLIAVPPSAQSDDTELFTTSVNPNVLLMLDVSGSMNDVAGGSSVGNLDGQGNTNSRMDVLWKVVYTLLNADLSCAGAPVTYTCKTSSDIKQNTSYSSIQVDGSNWSQFPSTNGTIQIGSSGQMETVTYSSKGTSGGNYYFYFSPSKTFSNDYKKKSTVSFSGSCAYSNPYPISNAEAINTDFQNNLTSADEEILKARLGLMTFTGSLPSSFNINIRNQITSGASNAPPFSPSYQNIWSSVKSYAYPSSYTPTAKALNASQTFFSTAYNSSLVCRPNYAVLITDGEDTMGGTDGGTPGTATYYHNNNVSYPFYPDGCTSFNSTSHLCTGSGQGQVGRHNAVISQAANLKTFNPSVNLYAVGVGISGNDPDLRVQREVLRRAAEQKNATGTVAEFNNIGASGDNTSLAAGKAFFATDASELSLALRNIFQQITLGNYSYSAPTVASVRMTDRNYLYRARFVPSAPPATFWEGRLEALTINTDNTYTSQWDAAAVLQATAPANRRIYTVNTSGSRIVFDNSAVTPAMLGVGTTAIRNAVVDYVRGVGHDNNSKLGDIFHSKPVIVGPPSRFFFEEGYSTAVGASQSFVDAKATRKRVLYVGTNDGMLHAFLSGTYNTGTGLYDNGTGEELFGFIPSSLLTSLPDFLPGEVTSHGYFVDSSPRIADVWIDANNDGSKQTSEWRTVLIGGLRKGGSSYFALDITDPPTGTDYSNYPKVLWEYSDGTNVAETWSEPFIGKVRMQDTGWSTARDRWVAIFGGGMSTDGSVGKSLVVLDIATGTAIKTFTTGIENIVVAPPSVALDANGYIKFAYAVDLSGAVYKFDFRTTGLRSNGFAAWTLTKIFQASAGQPAYHRIEPATISESNRYLFFGTGNQESPVSDGGTGKFFAIIDTDSFFPSSPLVENDLADLTSNLATGTAAATQYGWRVSLLNIPSAANSTDVYSHSGEKVLSDPVIFNNNVFFTTFIPDTVNPCSGGGIARVYGLKIQNATRGLAALSSLGESGSKVPYHVYAGTLGGIPSSPSLSIYPSGQSSIFVGFSTGTMTEIRIDSPSNMKEIKSWKETF